MADLLHGARDMRQKLYRLEVLLEIEKGRAGRRSPAGKAADSPERAAAIKRMIETGLVEPADAPGRFRITADGRDFLKDVRSKVGAGGPLDWTRADEIDFSRL